MLSAWTGINTYDICMELWLCMTVMVQGWISTPAFPIKATVSGTTYNGTSGLWMHSQASIRQWQRFRKWITDNPDAAGDNYTVRS